LKQNQDTLSKPKPRVLLFARLCYTAPRGDKMTWQEIVNNKDLANLPFKIETNEFGQVVMSPTKYIHGIYQSRLVTLIEQFLTNGITSSETAIATRKGVKVPDVAWSSYVFFNAHRDELDLSQAPELCAEIISPSNTEKEIAGKRKLGSGLL
jgi:Uma2 family endonuclease